MITISNFKTVLSACLGFAQTDILKPNTWTRVFRHGKDGKSDCVLSVDFEKQKFDYDDAGIDIGGGTTVSFAPDANGKVQNENFVVFECVVRLLSKGYKACDIFLEKKHTLGHSQKSGRLDITVAKDGNAYLIIECKTAGTEYKKARKELFGDPEGKQLFSYWAQARSTKWLQLYASDYDAASNAIAVEEEIIRSHDDRNIELLASKDATIALYKSASEATDAWRVWDETYHKETCKSLVFGDNCVAYNIGIQPLIKRNLRGFTQEDGFTNTFREILRHNAISDKENAFNKLLSLFICKFVDEARCSDQDVVAFQYKDGQDDYYSLYERLLALFQIGMKDYLKEEVFYLENDYITKTLDTFTGKKRKELEAELKDKFQKTKMLSCQVFAFREVYNETLFLQNGKVLVEIVKLMQQYQFAYSSKEQLLGDLFENLLSQGFKQEAGQFFTPTPITRFVWNALPYERFLNCAKKSVPRVIDFACGSGHFLTEGIAAISDFYRTAGLTKEKFPDSAISRKFFGIEKDNRLAKVSKIAMILNGALEGRIKADDGLEHDEDFLGRKHSFDILVANPPYSVDSFKTHESVAVQKAYETISLMSIDCSRIQNVFVERMEHLLKSGGIAAIVLPSPFLTNDESDTNKAREILLHNFTIRAIAEFGNKSFAETGTNTVILFLEHFDFPPRKAVLLKDTVDAILSGEELSDWEDREIFSAYLATIGVAEKDYIEAMSETILPDALNLDYFRAYVGALLSKGAIAKDVEKAAKEKDPVKKADVKKRIKERFYAALKETERAKLLAFALTRKQKTVLVKSPTDNDEQERFLGYKFSKRRNSEGLSETGTSQLTNGHDRADKTKISYAIKNAFADDYVLPDGMNHVSVVNTADMFDFSRPYFDWSFSLSTKSVSTISSKFHLVKMEDVINLRSGQDLTPDRYNDDKEGIPYITGASNFEGGEIIINRWTSSPTSIANKGDLLITCKGTVGKMAYLQVDKAHIARQIMGINAKNNLNLAYLKYILEILVVNLSARAKGMIPGIKREDILNADIPLPPLDVQEKVVAECEKVDGEYNTSRMAIEEYRAKIAKVFADLEVIIAQNGGGYKKMTDICFVNVDTIDPGAYPDKEFTYVDIDAVRNGEGTFVTDKKILGSNAPSRARRLARSNSTLVSTVRPNLKGFAYVENEIKDAVYSTGFAVLKSKDTEVLLDKMIYYMFMYSNDLMEQMIAAMPKGSYPSINKDDIENFIIPIPPIDEQKKIVAEVVNYESRIAKAKAVMDSAPARKQAILRKYGVIA